MPAVPFSIATVEFVHHRYIDVKVRASVLASKKRRQSPRPSAPFTLVSRSPVFRPRAPVIRASSLLNQRNYI